MIFRHSSLFLHHPSFILLPFSSFPLPSPGIPTLHDFPFILLPSDYAPVAPRRGVLRTRPELTRCGGPGRRKCQAMEVAATAKIDANRGRFRSPESIGVGRTGDHKMCDEMTGQGHRSRGCAKAIGAGHARPQRSLIPITHFATTYDADIIACEIEWMSFLNSSDNAEPGIGLQTTLGSPLSSSRGIDARKICRAIEVLTLLSTHTIPQ